MTVLFFREDAMWVAQGLEYDIAAQGETLAEAKAAFAGSFAAQIAVALHHDEDPLADFGKAPQEYWDMLTIAQELAEPIRAPEASENIPPAFMIDAMQKTLATGWVAA